MSNGILKGKKGIIFGALDNKSIAWKVAEFAHLEEAEIVLTNAPIALRMGTINELSILNVSRPARTLELLESRGLLHAVELEVRRRCGPHSVHRCPGVTR